MLHDTTWLFFVQLVEKNLGVHVWEVAVVEKSLHFPTQVFQNPFQFVRLQNQIHRVYWWYQIISIVQY